MTGAGEGYSAPMTGQIGKGMAGAARVGVVVLMFLVVPVGVWWLAAPMISDLPLSEDIRRLLMLSVLATVAFGGASGLLVLKGMAEEP